MARIFFSYSIQDRLQAIALKGWLEEADPRLIGLEVGLDAGIMPGTRWRDEVRAALSRADIVLVLFSVNWQTSSECLTEFRAAENLGKKIVIARLEAIDGISAVEHWQWIDLFGMGPTTCVSVENDQTVEFQTSGLKLLLRVLRSEGLAATQRAPLAGVISDRETNIDALGISGDVDTLAQILAATAVSPPLSVALLGDWGTGKSSLMSQLRDRVAALAGRSPRSTNDPFVSNVRQVVFNAWHYSDDHLWVGLVEHLLRELADAGEVDPAVGRIGDLETAIAKKQNEYTQLKNRLDAIDALDDRGVLETFYMPLRALQVASAARVDAGRGLRNWQMMLALGAFAASSAVVVAAGRLIGLPSWLSASAAGLFGMAATVAGAWRWLSRHVGEIKIRLNSRRTQLEAELQRQQDVLNGLDPTRRLDQLLIDIARPDRYENYRGLIGRIHYDLCRLSEDLRAAGARWVATGSRGTPPLQRIVLYVDDLDRCSPLRVTDVLQAMNLLLTMDLFMVVVAVDPRWLLQALELQHRELFTPSAGRDADRSHKVTPLDYLDKIFHIPIAMRPMGLRASTYLLSLLPPAELAVGPTTPASRLPENPHANAIKDPASSSDTDSDSNLAPEALYLRGAERRFLARVTPLLPTPRAVKKLANLYRLLRLSIPQGQLDDWVGDREGGPYQAAVLLLAALVGSPDQARGLLDSLASIKECEHDIVDELRADPLHDGNELGRDYGPLGNRVATLIETIRSDIAVHGRCATYRRWATAVARYGFETYDLYTDSMVE